MGAPSRKPPRVVMPGPIEWLRENLFSSPCNAVLTIVALYLSWAIVAPFVQWALIDAAFAGTSREDCLPRNGACWPFITARIGQVFYGFYDVAERWRVDIAYLVLAIGLFWLMFPRLQDKWAVAGLMLTVYPVIAVLLLVGGALGLPHVPTERWGGLLLTLVVAVTGIVASLPLGILLALGRRSELPVVRGLSVAFIEFWRGVPLITVLFMAANMLPLFLPDGVTINKLLSALIAVALFSSAYMAEVVRGGLQAIPKGQYEAACAVGLSYWQSMGFIILPQALRLAIPNIVGNFIGLLKDTSLVSIIGLFDLLGIIQAGTASAEWATPNTAYTGYVFAGAVFWVMCFGMSRYAKHMEEVLKAGERR